MFKRPQYQRASVPLTPATRRGVYAVATDVVEPLPKEDFYRSEKWLANVRTLYCMRCFREEAIQPAHRNEGKGKSIKTDDCLTAALCATCHAEIDQGRTMTRAERREALDVAILMTLRALVKRGLVVPK